MKKQLMALAQVASSFEKSGNLEAGKLITLTMKKIAQFDDWDERNEPGYDPGPEAEPTIHGMTRSDMIRDLEEEYGAVAEDLADMSLKQLYRELQNRKIFDATDREADHKQRYMEGGWADDDRFSRDNDYDWDERNEPGYDRGNFEV